MPVLSVGWEDGNMLLNGADTYVKTNVPIIITGYQISVSELPFAAMGDMVLFMLGWSPTVPTFSGKPSNYFNGVPNPDFGSNTSSNPNASQLGGGIGGSGVFFSAILKSANGEAANQNFALSGLAILIPAGSYIVAHMDGGGSASRVTDGEIQGCIFYSYPPAA
jgi:hypothetical protein